MSYIVKRTMGKNTVFLSAWCDIWGTACMASKKNAIVFHNLASAEAAARMAQATCKGVHGVVNIDECKFSVIKL